jgi:hypothetical protein
VRQWARSGEAHLVVAESVGRTTTSGGCLREAAGSSERAPVRGAMTARQLVEPQRAQAQRRPREQEQGQPLDEPADDLRQEVGGPRPGRRVLQGQEQPERRAARLRPGDARLA